MKQLNNYINEKLHLKKGIERLDDNFVKFWVVYPGKYATKIEDFDSYDEALTFAKKHKDLIAAYCMTQKQLELAIDAVHGEYIKKWWDVYKDDHWKCVCVDDWPQELEKCAKENNFMELYEYEKIR